MVSRLTHSFLFLSTLTCFSPWLHGQTWYEPPLTSVTLYAYVPDGYGNPIPGADLQLSNNYQPGSNGHTHGLGSSGPLPPVSTCSPSSGYANSSGYLQFQLSTTLVGQTETLLISSSIAPASTLYVLYVGYSGLTLLNNSGAVYQTGATAAHGGSNSYNHWMTANAATSLVAAVQYYLTRHSPQCKVCVNDSALPMGGKFDINENWINPHKAHDRGTAVDLATTISQCPQSFVIQDAGGMLAACLQEGADARSSLIHYPPDPPHVHCNWQNPELYPH